MPFPLALVQIVFAVLVAGALIWALDSIPAIDPVFRQAAKVLLIAAFVIWGLYVLYQLIVPFVR